MTHKSYSYIAIIAAIFIVAGCTSKEPEAVKEPARRVQVMQIAVAERPQIHRVSGRVTHPSESFASFKTGGIIQSIRVEAGDTFRRGDLLAAMDTTEIAAVARAAYENRVKLERDHERIQRLYDEQVVSLEQLQNTATALATARADEQRAKFNLSRSLIRAPFDGVVAMKLANENEMIDSGKPVLHIVEQGDHLTARLSIPARFINSLHIGDPVQLTFDEISFETEGSVSEIAAVADAQSGHYHIEVSFDNNTELREGMIARAAVSGPRQAVITLPTSVLVSGDKDRGKIFVVEDSVAVLREVKFIGFAGDSLLLEATIPDRAQVIVSGVGFLRDGSTVVIAETSQ